MKLGDEERETILQVIMMNNLDMVTSSRIYFCQLVQLSVEIRCNVAQTPKDCLQLSDVSDEASFHRCFSMFLSMFIKKKMMWHSDTDVFTFPDVSENFASS